MSFSLNYAPILVTGFEPSDLGLASIEAVGDALTNTMQGAGELPYTTLDNTGSLGNDFTTPANKSPVSVQVGGRAAPIFRGSRVFSYTGAKTDFSWLHNGTDDGSASVAFYLYEVVDGARVLGTIYGSVTRVGGSVHIEGSKLRYYTSNGSVFYLADSLVTLTAGWHTVTIRKVGATMSISVDNETPVSTVMGSPSAAVPWSQYYMGRGVDNANPLNGIIGAVYMWAADVGTSGISDMHSYLSGEWNATPDFSMLAPDGVDLSYHIDAARGVTQTGTVSQWNDQSGYGNHLVQATAAARPTFVSSWRNSLPALLGDGAGDFMSTPMFTQGIISQINTHFAVGSWSTAAGDILLDGSGAREIFRDNGAVPALYAGSSNVGMTASNVVAADPFIASAEFNAGSSKITMTIDGRALESETLASNPGTSGMDLLQILGAGSWEGHIAEAACYTGGAMVAGDKQDRIDEMSAKWDIVES